MFIHQTQSLLSHVIDLKNEDCTEFSEGMMVTMRIALPTSGVT